MSRRGFFGRDAGIAGRAVLGLGLAAGLGSGPARAQAPPARIDAGMVAGAPVASIPMLPPDVQVVRFQAPQGVVVEVLGPAPEPAPIGDGGGSGTFGLRVGVGYRLRLANLPNRPGVELFPVVEVVGHLHRPPEIDPGRFPIRVVFSEFDIEDVLVRGQLVTEVVYLEDPDLALPIDLPKDEIPIATLNPAEDPFRVGAALGRAMVIVRLGGRVPSPEEAASGSGFGLGQGPGACPYLDQSGGRCGLACGVGTPKVTRPGLPRDEFLCDGGDRDEAAHFAEDGGVRGIDPRDAVVRFNEPKRPRILPTNVVCIYAPRFAAVRTALGPNEALHVDMLGGARSVEGQAIEAARQGPDRLTQNQSAEAHRHRSRPSGLIGRVMPEGFAELRILQGFDTLTYLSLAEWTQGDLMIAARQGPETLRERQKAVGIKTAASAVVTGIVQGAGEAAMAWKPQEVAGVELPPDRPGVAVIKRVSVGVAEPGDVVTFAIQYRNMGNTPIRSVSVLDSLLPRLEYVAGSAKGPSGTVFTANPNQAGSVELRWDLPGVLAPGTEGHVTFEAKVR